ncbi:hypothetical protein [Nocardia cyriacigeorgica]|nr:hypothetical protein [Nocardia cyriacigeorgica]
MNFDVTPVGVSGRWACQKGGVEVVGRDLEAAQQGGEPVQVA